LISSRAGSCRATTRSTHSSTTARRERVRRRLASAATTPRARRSAADERHSSSPIDMVGPTRRRGVLTGPLLGPDPNKLRPHRARAAWSTSGTARGVTSTVHRRTKCLNASGHRHQGLSRSRRASLALNPPVHRRPLRLRRRPSGNLSIPARSPRSSAAPWASARLSGYYKELLYDDRLRFRVAPEVPGPASTPPGTSPSGSSRGPAPEPPAQVARPESRCIGPLFK
jgi:hypothetical protein